MHVKLVPGIENEINLISGAIVSVLDSSAVDRGFESNKGYNDVTRDFGDT